jgi:Double zinc ribbon
VKLAAVVTTVIVITRFCEECASPLARTCANCGTALLPAAKFCHACAQPAAGLRTPSRSPHTYTPKDLAERSSLPTPRHRPLTLAFSHVLNQSSNLTLLPIPPKLALF